MIKACKKSASKQAKKYLQDSKDYYQQTDIYYFLNNKKPKKGVAK